MRRLRSLAMSLLALSAGLVAAPPAHGQLFEGVMKDLHRPSGIQTPSSNRYWMSTDFLLWQTTGSKLPPLVTGNPLATDPAEAGVIGIPSTTILAGGGDVFDDARTGIRFSGGVNCCDELGLEGDFFVFNDEDFNYRFDGSNGVILGRPFINLRPGNGIIRYDTQLVHIPPDVDGSIRINGYSEFYGGGLRGVFHLLRPKACVSPCGGCDDGCEGGCDGGCDATGLCGGKIKRKEQSLSMMIGYRTLSLGEGVRIDESLVTTENGPPEQFDIFDQFDTDSRFHGIELGTRYGMWCGNFGVNVFGLLAAGINSNEVRINGQTAIDSVVEPTAGGILAQTSNIGIYDEDVAALSTQFGINLSARLMPCLIANLGYSGLYWSNVARVGDQIDLQVNPDLFPAPVAPPGAIGAQPTHKLSDFFAHGLNAGITVVF